MHTPVQHTLLAQEAWGLIQNLLQRLPLDEVHHQVLPAPLAEVVCDPWQVGVVQRGQHLSFSLEGLPGLLFFQRIGDGDVTHLFDGHRLVAQAAVGRFVHCPHAALSYLLDDDVAMGQHALGR